MTTYRDIDAMIFLERCFERALNPDFNPIWHTLCLDMLYNY